MDITSPIAGPNVADLVTPTYTLTADQALEKNQKAYVVSAIGGTQANVEIHSAASPFQVIVSRPKDFKYPSSAILASEGYLANAPVNEYKVITRKGGAINSGTGSARILIETRIVVPVGNPDSDSANLSAAVSAHVGALYADADALFDFLSNNVL